MRILALGAHPDDIEIYMFGTLAAYLDMGASVDLVIATDGAKGGSGDGEALSRLRKEEAEAAAALLGAQPHFLNLPDGELVADAWTIGVIKKTVENLAPDLVITHAPNDYHGDHRALSDATRTAISFSAPVVFVDTMRGVGFEPNIYVDITPHMERKIAAIRLHQSQNPERFVQMAVELARFRSSQCNAPDGYAETLRFDPFYPFADIRGLLPPAPPITPVSNRSRQRLDISTY